MLAPTRTTCRILESFGGNRHRRRGEGDLGSPLYIGLTRAKWIGLSDDLGSAGHRRRLRDRFAKHGLGSFADYEIVELLLTLAIPLGDVKPTAKVLVETFGNVRGILDASPDELRPVAVIGEVTPVTLRIIRESAILYLEQCAEEREFFGQPRRLGNLLVEPLGCAPLRGFRGCILDSGNALLRDGVERLEEGTIDRAAVYPRRVMEAAVRRGAASVVFAHNHPNGNVEPSDKDKILTRALILAASTLGIKVLDHLIISSGGVFSFRQERLL